MNAVFVGNKLVAVTGTRSQVRRAELDEHGGLRQRPVDVTGLKRIAVMIGKTAVVTPYGRKIVRRRRRANAIAKQARKVNR